MARDEGPAGAPAAPVQPHVDKEKLLNDHLAEVRRLAAETSPITSEMARAVPTWRAAYSDRTAALMAALCQIAYDRFDDKVVGQATREAMALRLARGGFRLVATYDPNACTQAFLAVSEQFAVLAFRGTTDAADWKVNLNAAQVQIGWGARRGVRVHKGFLEAYEVVHDQIFEDLKHWVPSSLGLYITGHSLGGALAQVASAALARDNLAACYTFGSPRVGRASFDERVKCPHYRVVNKRDIVPAVPPLGWRGYLHSGDARWLRSKGQVPSRRGRPVWLEAWWTLVALPTYLFTRKFFLVGDHMIWKYKEKLVALADNWEPFRECEPVGEAELAARFSSTILSQVRRAELTLLPSVQKRLLDMAALAASRVAQEPREGGARLDLMASGEVAFGRLIEEMTDDLRRGNELAHAEKAERKRFLDEAALDLALLTIGGYPPFWDA